MNKYQMMSLGSAAMMMIGIFVDLGLCSFLLLGIGLVLGFIAKYLSFSVYEKQTSQLEVLEVFHEIEVCVAPAINDRSHNVRILIPDKSRKPRIIVDDSVLGVLTRDELTATLLHEEGHLHTFNPDLLNTMQIVGGAIAGLALHLSLYNKVGNVILLILIVTGALCLFGARYLERFIEYKADDYAIDHGCDVTALFAAVKKIDDLNNLQSNSITMSGHATLEQRMNRIGNKYK